MRWVNRHMRRNDRMIAGAVPILALLVLYLVMAAQRHALNPGDKILPLPDAMARGLSALLFQADPLSGHFLFWTDTFASLERLGLGLALATLSALVAGLVLGVLPPVRATLGPLVTGIAVIPPIATQGTCMVSCQIDSSSGSARVLGSLVVVGKKAPKAT